MRPRQKGYADHELGTVHSYSEHTIVEIQLNRNNLVQGMLLDRYKPLVLMDSGATKSLISRATIGNSKYLSSIRMHKVDRIGFKVGNGNIMYSDSEITFEIVVQKAKFTMTAMVLDNLGGFDVVIGTPTLRRLGGVLDFSTGKLKLKAKTITMKPTRKTVLRPGESRCIEIRGNVPFFLKNSEVTVRLNKFLSRFSPNAVLVRLSKGKTVLKVENHQNKQVKIDPYKTIGCISLSLLGHTYHPITPPVTGASGQTPQVSPGQYIPPFTQAPNHHYNTVHNTPPLQRPVTTQPSGTLREQKKHKYPFLESNDPRLDMTDQQIIDSSIDLSTCTLRGQNIQKLRSLLYKHSEAFSLHGEVGDVPDVEISFKLNNTDGFYIRPYTVAQQDKPLIDKELKKLEQMGVISKGRSAYTSPLMVIKGKNGKTRIVSDLRYLNSRLDKENYPFPLVKDAIQTIGHSQCKVLSILDLKSAYFSLNLAKECQKYCGIAGYTNSPSYYYNKLPQGLQLSPAIWQNFISSLLDKIPNSKDFVYVIMDDLAIFSESEEKHLEHLEKILVLLKEQGLKISPSKTQIACREMSYMGHTIHMTKGYPTITPQKEKTEAIRHLPEPRTVRQVRSFVGAVNYLAMYLPKLQELLIPFYELTKKNAQFRFSEKHRENFIKIKALLMEPPVLKMPNSQGQLILYTDTSRTAAGASLWQLDDKGLEHLIGYHSKKLPLSCKNFSVSELEARGLIEGIKAFKYLLKGTHFKAFVDHSSLVQILKSKTEPPTSRLKRYVEILSDYVFDLGFRKGSSLYLTDFLSRNPNEYDTPETVSKALAFSALSPSQAEQAIMMIQKTVRQKDRWVTDTERQDENTNHFLVGTDPVTGNRRVTRAFAKLNNIDITTPSPQINRATKPAASIADPLNTYTPLATHKSIAPTPTIPYAQGVSDTIPDTHISQRVQSTNNTAQKHTIPQTMAEAMGAPNAAPAITLRQLAAPPTSELYGEQTEITELHEPPGEEFWLQDKPLLSRVNMNSIKTRHLPKQVEIDKLLNLIKKKALRDYPMPMDAVDMINAQKADSFFKDIYTYLASDMLPNNRRAAKRVLAQAENFILVEGILFRVVLDERRSDVRLNLAVPEKYVPHILEKYHDSILGSHGGIVRTCLTLRRLFYIPSVYAKVAAYIQTCQGCQERKGKTGEKEPMRARLPVDFSPMAFVSMDIKVMPRSNKNHQYILFLVCEVTKYVIAIPLKKADAITVAEKIMKKLIMVYGVPREIHCDAAAIFTGKLVDQIWRTLNVQQTIISPANHGSLICERYIQTVTNYLLANLKSKGQSWHLFLQASVFSHNSFKSPTTGGFSPHYLNYMRPPHDISGLKFTQVTDMATDYKQYLEILQQRSDHAARVMTELHTLNQQAQTKQSQIKYPEKKWQKGMIVFLLSPTSTSLQMNSKKIQLRYLGPLKIREMLDVNHAVLEDLAGNLISNVYHTKRLKPGFIRATNHGVISTSEQLKESLLGETPDKPPTPAPQHLMVVTETGAQTNYPQFRTSAEQLQPYTKCLQHPLGIATPEVPTQRCMKNIYNSMKDMPSEDCLFSISKCQFRNNHLEVLFKSESNPKFSTWINLFDHPTAYNIAELILTNRDKFRIKGSPNKMLKKGLW